jgi:cyclophilin family peptidyl-prolyl cis-trans isomerase
MPGILLADCHKRATCYTCGPVVKNYLLALLAGVLLSSFETVRAQEVTNTNHTVVRFEVSTGGQPFGSIDIELFDQEKPEAVKNFLRYVYRGVYSNLVPHRLVPNFVLQGGNVTITNPASTNAFSTYMEGANYGPITNEYSVGPELSNEFGTIAMARVGGQPNSASAQWFFNLTNNPFLDTVDGGFTVFGRVVNTTNAFTGTNLLKYFNTVPVESAFIPATFETFSELPVSGTPLPSPRYADLFTIQAKIIQGPQLPAPQHSVVRFNIFTGGTNFGNIDIELFDQEKPETVKNFLLYVYSGVYSNLVMHRLVPNFVFQAGRVRLADPNTNIAFSTYIPGVNWGPITNEYGVGPELGNDFGTIAMARVPGDTNSASADFFFNLTNNNATLNTNDGGFTVFGRVINSYDARSGTNLLNYFNTFSSTQGLGSAFIFDYFDFLTELAVSTNRSTVLVPDLFTVRSSVIQGVTERDPNLPVVTVSEPDQNIHRTTNATFHFAGTAADNQSLSRVLIDGPLGRYVAAGKTNWSFDVPLNPGTNRIVVRSLDEFGNLSLSQERVVFYSVPRPVTLQVQGKGVTSGITNGQILEVGVTYPITATPARGNYFLGWSGNFTTTRTPTLYFTMEEGAVVTCRFSRTLLGLTPGRYEGVFAPATNGLRKSVGQVTLSLRANGSYSGRLKPFGASYGIRGKFDANGQSLIFGTLGTNVLALGMGLYSEGQERIGGQYTDGTFVSDFDLWRQQVYGKTNASPYAGKYTLTLSPPLATNNAATDGSGFGTATVDSKGRITWTGVLANGIPLKTKASELKGGAWSFYYPTKSGEALAGEAKFTTNGTFSGNVKWFSPGFLPSLTNQNIKLTGARYTPPASGRPFDWTNGVLTISGGGLAQPIVSDVMVQPDGSLSVVSNTHNIQINITNATGLVGGTFQYPGSNTLTRLRGAVLQSSNTAAGFAPVSPRSPGFELRRAP